MIASHAGFIDLRIKCCNQIRLSDLALITNWFAKNTAMWDDWPPVTLPGFSSTHSPSWFKFVDIRRIQPDHTGERSGNIFHSPDHITWVRCYIYLLRNRFPLQIPIYLLFQPAVSTHHSRTGRNRSRRARQNLSPARPASRLTTSHSRRVPGSTGLLKPDDEINSTTVSSLSPERPPQF